MDSFLFYEHHLNQALVRLISEQNVRLENVRPTRTEAPGPRGPWISAMTVSKSISLNHFGVSQLQNYQLY